MALYAFPKFSRWNSRQVTDEKTIGSYRQTAVCGPYSPARSFMCSTDRFESTTENSRVRGYPLIEY
jgi:hypothetical protein